MRVVRCERPGPPEVLQVVEVPDAVAGPGQVVVAVSVAAITFIDTQIRAGRSPRGAVDSDFPRVPGNGISGIVIRVGDGVDAEWIGQEVVTTTGGSGGYAEQVVVPVAELHRLPHGVDARTAAALLADGRTALALARAASFGPEDRVLITAAAGGVGSLLVQLARNARVASVIALAGGERKLTVARELGADVAIDYREESWVEAVRASTDGKGVTVAFDGVGGAIGTGLVGLMAPRGRYVPYGVASGSPSSVDPQIVQRGDLAVVQLGAIIHGPADIYALVEQALTEAAAGRIKPIVGQTFRLANAAEAHAAIEARATIGKTLLIP